jgi:hypothetical protein
MQKIGSLLTQACLPLYCPICESIVFWAPQEHLSQGHGPDPSLLVFLLFWMVLSESYEGLQCVLSATLR